MNPPPRTTQPLPRHSHAAPPNTREPQASAQQRDPEQTHTKDDKNMRANINIATLNMNGLTAPTNRMTCTEKWSMVNQTLNKHKIAVLALQETHLDQEMAERIRESFGKKMEIRFSMDPNSPRAVAGVAFVINKSLIAPKSIRMYELLAGRALALEIDWLEKEMTKLVNIYAPNRKTDHPAFWADIEKRGELKDSDAWTSSSVTST